MSVQELTRYADDGARVGQDASDKVAFWGKTPLDQPASASQAAVTTSVTATVTTGDLASTVADIITLLNQLRGDLVSTGIIKGAA